MRRSEKRFTIEDALSALFKAYKIPSEVRDTVLTAVIKQTGGRGRKPYRQPTNTRFVVHGIKQLLGWNVNFPEKKIGDAIYIELDGKRMKTLKKQIHNSQFYRFDRKNGCVFAYIDETPDVVPAQETVGVSVETTPVVSDVEDVVVEVATPSLKQRVLNFVSRLANVRKSF